MSRPWHWMVLSVCVILAAVVSAGLYLHDFRSKAMGEARQLYYDAVDYLVACEAGSEEYRADFSYRDYDLIMKEATLAPYHQAGADGSFTVKISGKREVVYAAFTSTRVLFGRYVLRTTQVYPKGSAEAKSLEFYPLVRTEPDSGDNSNQRGSSQYVENSESENQG